MSMFLIGIYVGIALFWICLLCKRGDNSTAWVENIASGIFWPLALVAWRLRSWYLNRHSK